MPTLRKKKSLKQYNFTTQGIRKRNKLSSKLAEGNSKDQSRNKETRKTVEKKINETKSWFFKDINKTDKSLARLTKKKKKESSKKLQMKKGSCEFCQIFNEKLMQILLELFQKTEEEGILPNSFYKVRITISKPDKDTIRKENWRPK